MAKSNITLIKLLSTAGTGFYYTKKKNPRTKPEKLRFWKYDPIAGEHCEFEEAKLK
ncbi:MAG: 50S ribosomal protein L33 [Alphaproteobacteria bacterium]|nr:MAG: 50S ribosomal protein L33 [Alphaproteobacteria bacterium]